MFDFDFTMDSHLTPEEIARGCEAKAVVGEVLEKMGLPCRECNSRLWEHTWYLEGKLPVREGPLTHLFYKIVCDEELVRVQLYIPFRCSVPKTFYSFLLKLNNALVFSPITACYSDDFDLFSLETSIFYHNNTPSEVTDDLASGITEVFDLAKCLSSTVAEAIAGKSVSQAELDRLVATARQISCYNVNVTEDSCDRVKEAVNEYISTNAIVEEKITARGMEVTKMTAYQDSKMFNSEMYAVVLPDSAVLIACPLGLRFDESNYNTERLAEELAKLNENFKRGRFLLTEDEGLLVVDTLRSVTGRVSGDVIEDTIKLLAAMSRKRSAQLLEAALSDKTEKDKSVDVDIGRTLEALKTLSEFRRMFNEGPNAADSVDDDLDF